MMNKICVIFCLTMTCGLLSCRKDLVHWRLVERIETYTTHRLNRILLLPDGTGVIAGGEKFSAAEILVTHDHGATWHRQPDPGAGKTMYGLCRAPGGKFYMCGIDGKLITGTGNNDWQLREMVIWRQHMDIAFTSPNTGFLISTNTYTEGSIDYIDSIGTIRPGPTFGYGLNDIEMADAGTGYIAGHGVVMRTTDSGRSWQVQDIEEDNFTAVHAPGLQEAWACGYNGSIFHTGNGGQHWTRQRNGNDITLARYRLLDIYFRDRQHGFAVGENGLVIYSDDGGTHWMEFDRFTDIALRAIAPMKDGSLLVCGDEGSLYKLVPKYLQ
jgi:photosystem II stability/assembly factor-like uncharacterized protein